MKTMSAEFRKQLREMQKTARAHKDEHGNKKSVPEAETSRRVEMVLEKLCGYHVFSDLSREKRESQGVSDAVDFAIGFPSSEKVSMIVEVKSVSVPLSPRLYNQVQRYARKWHCPWTLLTNLTEWQLLHLDLSLSEQPILVREWNLLEDSPQDLYEHFCAIHRDGVRKGHLDKEWKKRQPLTDKPLIEALFSERVQKSLRTELKKSTGATPGVSDLFQAVKGQIPEHLRAIADGMFRPASGQKAAKVRRKRETEQSAEAKTATPQTPEYTPDISANDSAE
ncbi:MAG: type I restriction enzyme HsdR N-terminal domain-containing protein [Gammaproteobacteria bacterium]